MRALVNDAGFRAWAAAAAAIVLVFGFLYALMVTTP